MAIIQRCAELSQQLGYEEGKPANEVISQAEKDLGLDGSGLDLVQRCNNCCAALGISSAEQPPIAPVAATMAAAVPMAVVVQGTDPWSPRTSGRWPPPSTPPRPRRSTRAGRPAGRELPVESSSAQQLRRDVPVHAGGRRLRDDRKQLGAQHVHAARRDPRAHPALTQLGEAVTATLQPNGELAWSHGYGSRIVYGEISSTALALSSATARRAAELIQTKDIEECWVCCCFPFMWCALFKNGGDRARLAQARRLPHLAAALSL